MPETRQQEFVGKIKKCPNCGQVLQTFLAKCPSCGLELSEDVSGNTKSVLDFYDAYTKETDIKRQIAIVSSFPVANTKSELYQFAILADSQMESYQDAVTKKTSIFSFMSAYYGLLTGGLIGRKNRNTEDMKKELFSAWQAKLDEICTRASLVFSSGDNELMQILKIRDKANQKILESKKKQTAKIAFLVAIIVAVLIIEFFALGRFDIQIPEKVTRGGK